MNTTNRFWYVFFNLICALGVLGILVDLFFTFTQYAADSGDYSFPTLVFRSPYGIPFFVILSGFTWKAARNIRVRTDRARSAQAQQQSEESG